MIQKLTKFWFDFDAGRSSLPIGLDRGCGVTAYDCEDAMDLLRELVFSGREFPSIKKVVEGVDVSELDENHILANLGDVLNRGVWYPLGYDV